MTKERTLNELRQVKDSVYKAPLSHEEKLNQCVLANSQMYTREKVTDLIYQYIKDMGMIISEDDINWIKENVK